MGYRIDYLPDKQQLGRNYGFRLAMAVFFFFLFAASVARLWPDGSRTLRGILFSGNVETLAAALEGLADRLTEGMPVMEALVVFGQQILEGSGHGIS